MHHQRYLLQPSALEVFLDDRSNALLNLPSSEVCRHFPYQSSLCYWCRLNAATESTENLPNFKERYETRMPCSPGHACLTC